MTLLDATLTDIRGLLLMRSQMYKSKDRFARGQRQQTRSHALLNGIEHRIKRAKERYDFIREALVELSGPLLESSWMTKFRELRPDDLKGLTSLDEDGTTGEGHRKLTWIWKTEGVGANLSDSTNAGASLNTAYYGIRLMLLCLAQHFVSNGARLGLEPTVGKKNVCC